jgi:hypothetical protein
MNHWALWPIVGIINIMVFAIPALGLWLAGQKRWPLWCSIAILAWCAFYIASLFWLFPANDGP